MPEHKTQATPRPQRASPDVDFWRNLRATRTAIPTQRYPHGRGCRLPRRRGQLRARPSGTSSGAPARRSRGPAPGVGRRRLRRRTSRGRVAGRKPPSPPTNTGGRRRPAREGGRRLTYGGSRRGADQPGLLRRRPGRRLQGPAAAARRPLPPGQSPRRPPGPAPSGRVPTPGARAAPPPSHTRPPPAAPVSSPQR